MNCNTGHLVTAERMAHMDEVMRRGYMSVPTELQTSAIRKLNGADEAYVSLTSGGKLSKFAAQQRHIEKQKRSSRSKSRQARQSRRRNRH